MLEELTQFGMTGAVHKAAIRPLPPYYSEWLYTDGSAISLQPNVGPRFDIIGDSHIDIVSDRDWAPLFLNQLLFERAIPLAFVKRGFISLHAACVLIEDTAVIIAGPSGAGKSTLSAALHQRGHMLIADDCFMLKSSAGGTEIFSCTDKVRITSITAALLNIPGSDTQFHVDKFHLPSGVSKGFRCVCSKVLCLFLTDQSETLLTPVKGGEWLLEFFKHIWYADLLQKFMPALFLDAVGRFNRAAQSMRLHVSREVGGLASVITKIEELVQGHKR